jgi:hypothetical protein
VFPWNGIICFPLKGIPENILEQLKEQMSSRLESKAAEEEKEINKGRFT